MSNVYSFVAEKTGYENVDLTGPQIPLLNLSGTFAGPLNPNMFVPFLAPNIKAKGAGSDDVFVAPTLNKSLTLANAPPPVNLTAMNLNVPSAGPDPTVVAPSLGDTKDSHGHHGK